ncbi:MAG: hypothetical protein WAW10_07415 [Gallionella sp.]
MIEEPSSDALRLNVGFDTGFPFDDVVFLSSKPMTDAEFAEYVKPASDKEVSIDDVDFTDRRGM